MKLYYSPGACSLAGHIALNEIGKQFDTERVDLKTKLTASGADFNSVTSKGYVPALVLDNGELLTENIAVLDYIASQYPELSLDGQLSRSRLLEALAYISTEIHKSFKPFWREGSDTETAAAGAYINKRLQYLADTTTGDFLMGNRPSVADYYLFVMLLWANKFGIPIPAPLADLYQRLGARPSVQSTLRTEGLA